MQWLIDIVLEAVAALGYLTHAFVDRGDAGDYDLSPIDFNPDGLWHDINLSGVVPAGATAIAAFVFLLAAPTFEDIAFQTKGNVNGVNISMIYARGGGLTSTEDIVVPLPADRKIQYLISASPWHDIYFVVKGWWL